MFILIINKILLMVFVLSCVNIVWHTFFFIQAYVKTEVENSKYWLTPRSLLFLGLSIAYVLTSIITGINL
jgi:hypothetical protein